MRRTPSALVLALFSVVCWPGSTRAAFIDSNLAVSSVPQRCYPISVTPGLLDMLTLINPEWAPVDIGLHTLPLSDPVTVHGTVALAKVNEGGDFPGDHVTDDENTFITVDAAEMGLVGTGNVNVEGVEAGSMEVEWEISSYPLFAWPGTGNRLTAIGRWIWDCGHPSPNPVGTCAVHGTVTCTKDTDCVPPLCPACVPAETCVGATFNYHSEVHPPQAVAVVRDGAYGFSRAFRFGKRSVRTDVWISPDGGGAGDACFLNHEASDLNLLSKECFPLSQPLANVNASDFAFDIPLPPRPVGSIRPPSVRTYDQTPLGLPRAPVTTTFVDGPSPKLQVVVHMTAPVGGILPSKVGKTIVAAWGRDPTPVTHVRLRVTGIEIVNPLKPVTPVLPVVFHRCSGSNGMVDCSSTPCPVGETCLALGGPTPGWQMWLEVNGNWQLVPRLDGVQSPVTVLQNLRYDLSLPPGGTVNLHITGKSLGCLEKQLYGQSLRHDLFDLYGLNDGATCLQDMSKDIGQFNITLSGPDFGSGGSTMTYVTPSVGGAGGHCSVTTTQLCVTNADCPGETCVVTGSAFKLHYSIRKY
jgi:hypothetical protein